MNWLKARYHALSQRDRRLLKIFIIFILLAIYLFYAAIVWNKMFYTWRMADRRADRIEKRIGELKVPELEDGVSDYELNKLLQEKTSQEKIIQQLAAIMLPLDDTAPRQKLKLYLTRLAQKHQLRLTTLKTNNATPRVNAANLKGEELRSYLIDRPTFSLSMTGNFANLMRFIDSLKKMEYQVYVDGLSISHAENNGLLKIEMVLKI